MTIDTILVEATPLAARIALLAGGRLVELHVDHPGAGPREGDVLVGRVVRVVPGLDACFVALPGGETGFLGASDAGCGTARGADRQARP